MDAGEIGLDADYEAAVAALEVIEAQQAQLRREEQVAAQERAGLAARVEALNLGLTRRDATSALLAATDHLDGLLGSVAALLSVRPGYETAVGAALGAAADAVAAVNLDAVVGALDHLKAADLGRAGLLPGGGEAAEDEWPKLPGGRQLRRRPGRCTPRPGNRRTAITAEGCRRRRSGSRSYPGRLASRPDRRHPRRRPSQRPLCSRWLVGTPEPDRSPGSARRRRAPVGRGQSCLRATQVRTKPAGGVASAGEQRR